MEASCVTEVAESGADNEETSRAREFALEEQEPSAVLTAIESLLVDLLESLARGVLPDLEVPTVRRGVKRTIPLDADAEPTPQEQNVFHVRVSFTAAKSTDRFARIIQMLAVVHELVRTGRSAPQRDVYYQLKGGPLFNSPRDVAQALQDVGMLLGVPRGCLGVSASSRGLVAGPLLVQRAGGGAWMDCAAAARSIPGDCLAVQAFQFHTEARHLVVVEKDAVFQRLVDEGFPAATGSVLVTAKGMPDLSTRAFLAALTAAAPHLACAGVVDWNPCGLAILRTYHCGGSASLEARDWGLPRLSWLALRAEQADGLPEDAFQPLTPHDWQVIRSLRASGLQRIEPGWMHELDVMAANGVKAELEAAYKRCGWGAFARDLAERLAAGRFA